MGALSVQLNCSDRLFAKPLSTAVLVLQTSSSALERGMTTFVTPPALFSLVTNCIPRQVFRCRSFRINVSRRFTSSSFSAFMASFSFALRYSVRIHAESARIRRVLSFSRLYIYIRTLVERAMGFSMPFLFANLFMLAMFIFADSPRLILHRYRIGNRYMLRLRVYLVSACYPR